MAMTQVYCVHMRISASNSVLIGFGTRAEALSIAKKITNNTNAYKSALAKLDAETGRAGKGYAGRYSKIVTFHVNTEDKIRQNPCYKKDPVDKRNFYHGKSRRQDDLMYKDSNLLNTLVVVNEVAVESVFYSLSVATR